MINQFEKCKKYKSRICCKVGGDERKKFNIEQFYRKRPFQEGAQKGGGANDIYFTWGYSEKKSTD